MDREARDALDRDAKDTGSPAPKPADAAPDWEAMLTSVQKSFDELPAVGQVCWWWRIHQAAPDAPPHVAWRIGWEFDLREEIWEGQESKIDWSFEYHDLWVYLAWAPWRDSRHQERYEKAIRLGVIPARQAFSQTLLKRREALKTFRKRKVKQ
jgi:hypothetical protein